MTELANFAEDESDREVQLPKLGTLERKSMIIEALKKHVIKWPLGPVPGAFETLDKTIPQSEDL